MKEMTNKKGLRLLDISTPLITELPFILIIIHLLGGADICDSIENIRFNVGESSADLVLISRISLLFLFAYIGASVITVIKHKAFKWSVKVLIYVFILMLCLTNSFISDNFGLDINPTLFVLLAETTSQESTEFVNQYILSTAIYPTLRIAISYILAIVTCEFLWHALKKKTPKVHTAAKIAATLIVGPILLTGIYSTKIYYRMYNAPSADHIRFMHPPKDPISSLYYSWIVLRITESNMNDFLDVNRAIYEKKESFSTVDDNVNIVVIIGESFIKWHSQLYGYNLETTPNLAREEKEGRLFVFNDAVSSSNYTSVVMRNIFCCNNSSNGEQWFETPFFPIIFKQSGYNVYLWDNQYAQDTKKTYSFTLNSFLYNSNIRNWAYTKTNDVSNRYDGELVEAFRQEIGTLDKGKNLVLLHLMGQHYTFSRRFPKDTFTRFTVDSIMRDDSYLKKKHKQRIADYDNATLYNDHVVNSIIDMFKESNTIIIYFSDHGEEVYDYRGRQGRQYGALNANILKYQYDVPFMVWCSDKFQSNYPDKVDCIRKAVDHPFMTDNVCNMLFNVGGITTPYYRDSLDVINPNYRSSERIINGHNYNDIRFSSKKIEHQL